MPKKGSQSEWVQKESDRLNATYLVAHNVSIVPADLRIQHMQDAITSFKKKLESNKADLDHNYSVVETMKKIKDKEKQIAYLTSFLPSGIIDPDSLITTTIIWI